MLQAWTRNCRYSPKPCIHYPTLNAPKPQRIFDPRLRRKLPSWCLDPTWYLLIFGPWAQAPDGFMMLLLFWLHESQVLKFRPESTPVASQQRVKMAWLGTPPAQDAEKLFKHGGVANELPIVVVSSLYQCGCCMMSGTYICCPPHHLRRRNFSYLRFHLSCCVFYHGSQTPHDKNLQESAFWTYYLDLPM